LTRDQEVTARTRAGGNLDCHHPAKIRALADEQQVPHSEGNVSAGVHESSNVVGMRMRQQDGVDPGGLNACPQ
jgi:hypothetical protein